MVVMRRSTAFRKQQIVEVAASLIFKYGSEHLTVKRIAREVGISEAAIYRHFKSKKSILAFLLDHIEAVLLAELSRERIGSGPVTLETIEMTVRDHFSAIDLRKGMSFQVIAEIISFGDKNLNRKASRAIGKYIERLRGLLSEGVKSGSVREDIDLEASATLLFGLIQGLVNIWALDNGSFNLIERYNSLWQIYRESVVRRPMQGALLHAASDRPAKGIFGIP
ncbi:MAG: TetR/AcrR family transcriptional regulator [Thermodesulfobacteriota bacterium]